MTSSVQDNRERRSDVATSVAPADKEPHRVSSQAPPALKPIGAMAPYDFTGERFMPSIGGELRYEHMHRYAHCAALVSGKRVLDIASGEGYGSAMLRRTAAEVIGVDISADAVAHAEATYGHLNGIRFEVGSCSAIPLADHSVDVVVSFETLEHIAEHEQMMHEVVRVLRADGLLIVSTPDRITYNARLESPNEYHVRELDQEQFGKLVGRHFASVAFLGQRLATGSLIYDLGAPLSSGALQVYTESNGEVVSGTPRLIDPVYQIAICSNGVLPDTANASWYLDTASDLAHEHVEVARWAVGLQAQSEAAGLRIVELQNTHQDMVNWAKSLDAELGALRDTHVALQREHEKMAKWATNNDAKVAETGDRAAALQARLDASEGDARALQAQLRQAEERAMSLAAENEQGVARIEELRAQVDELAAKHAGLRDENDRFETRLSELATAHRDEMDAQSMARRELAALKAGQVSRDLDLERLHLAHEQSRGELEQSQRVQEQTRVARDDAVLHCERQQAQIIELDRELMAARNAITAFRRSTSWRVTYPLRAFKRGLGLAPKLPVSAQSGPWLVMRRAFRTLPIDRTLKDRVRMWLFDRYSDRLKHLPFHAVWKERREGAGFGPALPELIQSPVDLTPHERRVEATNIMLATSRTPLVSVIIPVFGKLDYTLQCLRSIQQRSPLLAYEVIVVDDRSPDDTVAVISTIEGVRLVVNESNQGFIRSCNAGASQAHGRYLCFLNNDTEVADNWLDELHATYGEFTRVGMVGSKLIYPDGRLQEAGGIIWNDGSAWNFGRGQDPTEPAFNYARQVDYCSGASILIESALFESLGGFDEHYLPAYGEDSDLALKIAARGLKVMYQPLSMVIHHEGVTSGTDTASGTKAYQVDNARKLFERWKTQIAAFEPSGQNADRAKDRGSRYRALVLDHCTPTPDQDAGSITAFNLLLLLRQSGFQVTFVPEDNFLYMPAYTPDLQRRGIEVIYAPHVTSVEQHLAAHGARYDLVLIIRPTTAERHLARVRQHCHAAKILFHTSDVHFLRMSREAELMGDESIRVAAEQMRVLELETMTSADAVIVHSTAEKELLQSWIPDEPIHVFPWAIPIRGTLSPFADRKDIAFIGGYQHYPNVDAVKHFVANVFPLIRERHPGIRFLAIGSKPPQELLDLAAPDIVVTGFVDDLAPLLDTVRVAVAPLRYGAGIKGKIGTTLSIGLPCVSTAIGAEGMGLSHGVNVLIADEHAQFASAVLDLYDDEQQWARLSTNGIEFARATYGPEAARGCIERILAQCGFDVDFEVPFTIFGPTGKADTNAVSADTMVPSTPVAAAVRVQAAPTADVTTSAQYRAKAEQELAIFADQINVHDLPSIFHYWSNKHLAPMLADAGISTIESFFAKGLQTGASRTGSARPAFISIGSGNCDVEIGVAEALIAMGLTDFSFECIDFNPQMIERGRVAAAERGVAHVMHCAVADFNTWQSTGREYDGVMANQSLHHVTDLEHLFEQIKSGLADKGTFVVSDMIGRNGHQRWPESLQLVNDFWKELPDRNRFNVLLNRHEEQYENWDCSSEGFEGIRAQDIVPLLLKTFHFEHFVGFASAIDIFVDRCFGHHFDAEREWDKAFIDRVHEADEAGLRSGRLTPTHMFAVLGTHPVAFPYFCRGLTPEASVRQAD